MNFVAMLPNWRTRLVNEMCVIVPGNWPERPDYISAMLADSGYAVQRQEYIVDNTTCANLEVEIPGTTNASEIVIIGAHYDSVPNCPAANDNGSGVAALLSLASTFADSQNARTLRFVAFVNEEQPYAHTPRNGFVGVCPSLPGTTRERVGHAQSRNYRLLR